MNLDLVKLEQEISTLYLNNPNLKEMKFRQSLNGLLQEYPGLLQKALEVDSNSKSFLLLLLEQIFQYTIQYKHPVYNPYFPQTAKELELLQKVLEKHFSEISPQLMDAFKTLMNWEEMEAQAERVERESELEEVLESEERKEEAEQACKVPDLPDPGILEDCLQEFWTVPHEFEVELPASLTGTFPSWAQGVVNGLKRTFYLYKRFQQSEKLTVITREDVRFQPHHRAILVLIGAEFYWIYNKREINVSNMSYQQAKLIIQDYLFTVSDLFLKLLPEGHPYLDRVDAKSRRAWQFERIRGVRGAKKVLGRFEDPEVEFFTDCSGYNINIRNVTKKKVEKEAEESIVKSTGQEVMAELNIKIPDKKDPGLDQDFLFDCYLAHRSEHTWPDPFYEAWPAWARGIAPNLPACLNLYHDFKNSIQKMKIFQSHEFQPHHKVIRLLCAAEYYWQFNIREITLDEDMDFNERRDIQREHIYQICEQYIKLMPENHGAHELLDKHRDQWNCEKIRGSSGASKVIFEYTETEGHRYLVECTGSSIHMREVREEEEPKDEE